MNNRIAPLAAALFALISQCSCVHKNAICSKASVSPTWGIRLSLNKTPTTFTGVVRITNLSSKDEFLHGIDQKRHFYGRIVITSPSGTYELIERGKYTAHVEGSDHVNLEPIFLRHGESTDLKIDLKRDYLASRLPSQFEREWIGRAMERGSISLKDRFEANQWWDLLNKEKQWTANAVLMLYSDNKVREFRSPDVAFRE